MYIEKDGVARVVPLVAKLTTMLSHRRDQIVEGRTSIFRVTPRQKHPAVVRTAPVQFLENTSIYLSLRATAVYYVYTGTTSHLSLFPPFLPPVSFPWTAGSDVRPPFSGRSARTTLLHDGIPPNINLVQLQDLPALHGANINLFESLTEKQRYKLYVKIPLGSRS